MVVKWLDEQPPCYAFIDSVWDVLPSFNSNQRQMRIARTDDAIMYAFWEMFNDIPRDENRSRRFRLNICFNGKRVSVTEEVASGESAFCWTVRGTEHAIVEAHLRGLL